MKNWVRRFLLPACVLPLLVLGYFMPRMAGGALNRSLEREVWEMEDRGVSLTLTEEMDVLSRMELFAQLVSREHTQVELKEGSELAGIGARAAAEDVMARLEGVSVMGAAVPYLLTGEDDEGQTRSGIFWRCVWQFDSDIGDIGGTLWIDDQTGLLMGFDLSAELFRYLAVDGRRADFSYLLQDFCASHYPVDGLHIDDLHDETLMLQLEKHLAVYMELGLDMGGAIYMVPIEIGDRVRFNMTQQTVSEVDRIRASA